MSPASKRAGEEFGINGRMFGLRFGPDFVGEFCDAGHGKLHTNEEEESKKMEAVCMWGLL